MLSYSMQILPSYMRRDDAATPYHASHVCLCQLYNNLKHVQYTMRGADNPTRPFEEKVLYPL